MKKILLILIVWVFFIPRAQAKLIGAWDFNEGSGNIAHDSSGNGNDATGLNGTWVPGKYGFGTDSDHIIIQNPNSSLLTSSSLTIESWAKINDFNGLQRRIVEFAPNYGLLINPQNNQGLTPPILSLNNQNYGFQFQDIQKDQWFHTAVTWDGNTAQYYLNGVEAPPVQAKTTIKEDGNVPFDMGAQGLTIDEVKVYNNVLSENQIVSDMNDNSTVKTPEPPMWIFLIVLLGFVLIRGRKYVAMGRVV